VSPSSRQNAIAEHLRTTGWVTIAEVEQLFGVSPVTARRDLAVLERRGVLRRTHGGAVLPASPPAIAEVAGPGPGEALAGAAVAALTPGESVFLDSSPASYEVARAVVEAGLALTVLTNSVRVMHLLFESAGPALEVIGLGGTLRRQAGSFVGPATVRAVGEHFADRLFLGAAGVTPAGVMTEADPLEGEIKRAMIAQARESSLLLDPGTLAGHGLIAVAEVVELSSVIAAGVPEDALDPVRAPGVELLAVG
jgi:DeoR/GlpR family transcriptional regulator of sugar metabolism